VTGPRANTAPDDEGGHLRRRSCYVFLAVFPLLLLPVTGLGFALSGDASLQRRVLHSLLAFTRTSPR